VRHSVAASQLDLFERPAGDLAMLRISEGGLCPNQ